MFTVRCFKPHTNLEMGFCFYVLNRGKNSGRPSYSPNPNCFVVSCNTREEREQLYWACKALHINRRFYPYLRGSVIEFIVIADFKHVLAEAHRKFKAQDADLLKAVKSIGKLAAYRVNQEKTIALIDSMQMELLAKIYIK